MLFVAIILYAQTVLCFDLNGPGAIDWSISARGLLLIVTVTGADADYC